MTQSSLFYVKSINSYKTILSISFYGKLLNFMSETLFKEVILRPSCILIMYLL